ncbi:RNAse (barnase) inhibitor barstar [Curtobacterium sp. PhB142]|nr:RNAse (barnase) inhibitor barstar [Curtobacterium sp. PhB142]TCM04823.1 RNAse (barnase) inhibitor barstar [Curtobacterium sp. PhB134]
MGFFVVGWQLCKAVTWRPSDSRDRRTAFRDGTGWRTSIGTSIRDADGQRRPLSAPRARPYCDLLAYYGSSVPAFSTDNILGNRLDFEIARDGFVGRLRNDAVLRNAETWLRREGYRVIAMDAGAWSDDEQMLMAFAKGLQFPRHFGKNLDALNDCMSDVAEADYGWDASETGLVLILSGFDHFAQRLPRTADSVQQILQRQGRYAALFGNRLLTILS